MGSRSSPTWDPDDLIMTLSEAKALFALPEEAKRTYAVPGGGGARGYTAFGIETAKGATAHDLKEFWHVGRELPPGHRFRETMADNVWPAEVPGFKESFLKLYDTFDQAGRKILAAIARHLGLQPDYFDATVEKVIRFAHAA